MDQNAGAIREGHALLSGVLRCGRCGGKLFVQYKSTGALYFCDGGLEKGTRRCASFGSKQIDQAVGDQLLRACSAMGIEIAERACAQRADETATLVEAAQLSVQAAEHEAARALDQFDLCDPKNRLVADTLESRLNEKLSRVRDAKERLEQIGRGKETITDAERERLQDLARDLPAVWTHPKADPKLKKVIIRLAIQEIMVTADQGAQRLKLMIHWQGGAHTADELPLPCRAHGGRQDPDLEALLRKLASDLADTEIARVLNMQGVPTAHGLKWTQARVTSYRRDHSIPAAKRPQAVVLSMSEAMKSLGISREAMLKLATLGLVRPNQITDFAPWRITRAELETDGVRNAVSVLRAGGRLPRRGSLKDQGELFAKNTEE